jgi:hypothetical protein
MQLIVVMETCCFLWGKDCILKYLHDLRLQRASTRFFLKLNYNNFTIFGARIHYFRVSIAVPYNTDDHQDWWRKAECSSETSSYSQKTIHAATHQIISFRIAVKNRVLQWYKCISLVVEFIYLNILCTLTCKWLPKKNEVHAVGLLHAYLNTYRTDRQEYSLICSLGGGYFEKKFEIWQYGVMWKYNINGIFRHIDFECELVQNRVHGRVFEVTAANFPTPPPDNWHITWNTFA